MDRNFNNTELEEDIREAIPAGKLDEVFHDMCIKWPKVKGCMKHFIDLIEDCWAKGDKVTKVMDSMVNFFCGDNNDGARIARKYLTQQAINSGNSGQFFQVN